MKAAARLLLILTGLLVSGSWAFGQAVPAPEAPFQSKPPEANWPEPVGDAATFGLLLLDTFEYQNVRGSGSMSWDIVGWYGGDYQRLWIKSEGRHGAAPASEGDGELQLLYGKLISSYFDAQVGIRVDRHFNRGSDVNRAYAVVGLQGLAPYRFEIEPTLFVSNKGQILGRVKATYDVLFTQRLILQPRLEANVAVQKDEAIGVGSGLNDIELGTRLRFEVGREFAPYIGFTWKQSVGATHGLIVRDSGTPSYFALVGGLRVWF